LVSATGCACPGAATAPRPAACLRLARSPDWTPLSSPSHQPSGRTEQHRGHSGCSTVALAQCPASVAGIQNEWSDELAKLPGTLADAQVARWQSKYGRDPTGTVQHWQRSWLLVNKIRTPRPDIAMMGSKLNAHCTGRSSSRTFRTCTRSHFRPRERRDSELPGKEPEDGT
jgi:hypothetical protein